VECVPPWRVLGSATATQQEAAGASRRRGRQGGGGPLAGRRAERATPLTAGRRAAKMQGIGVLHGSEGCQRCAGSYPGGRRVWRCLALWRSRRRCSPWSSLGSGPSLSSCDRNGFGRRVRTAKGPGVAPEESALASGPIVLRSHRRSIGAVEDGVPTAGPVADRPIIGDGRRPCRSPMA
jgi:hypothetical protein